MDQASNFRHLGGGHKGLFLALRYVFIIAASYLLMSQARTAIGPAQALMIAVALGSNVLLSRLPAEKLFSWYVEAPILVADTLWVSWALSSTGSLGGEFFLLYFLVLFLASTGENLLMVALSTLLVSAANVYFVWGGQVWTSDALLRVVFFFAVALFYGHVVGRIKHEQARADRGEAWAKELEAKVMERTAALQRTCEESLEANRAKSEFLASMSHELRTPLHIIIGYAEMLEERGAVSEHKRCEVSARVRKAASGLLHLVDNVLDLGRLEAGKVHADVAPVAPASFMVELQSRDWPQPAPGVVLRWDVAADLPTVETDADKLAIVLGNLIGNAIKFTSAGSVTIGVRDRRADGYLEFRVDDTGRGISEEELARIFEPFHQVTGSEPHGPGGVGLGLAIVQRYVALLGARLEVRGVVGRGTSFSVLLPYRSVPEGQVQQDRSAPRSRALRAA